MRVQISGHVDIISGRLKLPLLFWDMRCETCGNSGDPADPQSAEEKRSLMSLLALHDRNANFSAL